MSPFTFRPQVLVDVDGVLRDFIGGLCSVYKREYPDHDIKFIDSRRLEDFFPIGEEIYDFIDHRFRREILEDAPAYEGAVAALEAWEEKYEIVIATAQPTAGRGPTMVWLGKHDVPTNEIQITYDKHLLAGFVLLDDFIDNLEAFRDTDRLAVCLDQPWNQSWDGPRVKNVHEFFEFLDAYVAEQNQNWDDGPLIA